MPTPESKVKVAVKAALIKAGVYPFSDFVAGRAPEDAEGVFYMPVAGPFAVHGVHDFVGCWHGVFFSLETKAPDNPEDATPHQEHFRCAVDRTKGVAFTGVRDASVVERLRYLVYQRVSAEALEL